MTPYKAATLCLGIALGMNLTTGIAMALTPAASAETRPLDLEGFIGFKADGTAGVPADDKEVVTVSRDLSSQSQLRSADSVDSDTNKGDWDRATMLAAVVAGFGLTGALALRAKVPQLNQWLSQRGLSVEPEQVNIVAVKNLGANTSLAVVDVFNERLVLGVSAGQISLLTRTDTGAAGMQERPPAPTFGKMLDRAMVVPSDGFADDVPMELASLPPESQDAADLSDSSTSLSAVLKEALNRRQHRAEAAPGTNPWAGSSLNSPATRASVTAPRDGLTWNRTLPQLARAEAATHITTKDGAADQVLRKLQTMRRIR